MTEPTAFANGSGAKRLQTSGQLNLIQKQLRVRPRDPEQHMKLLAAANRRVAGKDTSVSPFCQVSFVNEPDRYRPIAGAFTKDAEIVPFAMPYILMGIDLDGLAKDVHESARAIRADDFGLMPDHGSMNANLRRRP